MLDDNRAFDHIKREIESMQGLHKKTGVAAIKNTAVAAVPSGPALVKKGATSGVGGGGRRSTTSTSAAASSTSASATGSGSAAASSTSGSASGSRQSGGRASEADVSTSSDVERSLDEQFTKHAPQLYHGDFKDVIRNNTNWKGKYDLVMLDPPFGILPEEHDEKILTDDLFAAAAFLLMPGGMFFTYIVLTRQ